MKCFVHHVRARRGPTIILMIFFNKVFLMPDFFIMLWKTINYINHTKMKKSILSHLAAFACGVLLVCGVSMTAPHHVSSGVYGDVNGDGVVDIDDLNEVINVMVGKPHGGERAILVSEESLTFTGEVDGVYTQTLTVGSDNLHGAVNAMVLGGDGAFGVAPTTLSLEQVQRGVELTVAYAPTSAGTHMARLLLTSEGAPSVTVTFTGTASGSEPATQTFTVNGVSFKMIAIEGARSRWARRPSRAATS